MRKALASLMTLLSLALGLALLGMGVMNVAFSRERYRPLLVLVLFGGCLALLLLTMILARFADPDYRPLFSPLFNLLALGLALLGIFFSVMWVALSPRAYGICLAALLSCYGAALLLAALLHHFLAQRAWRPFLVDAARQLPHIYWRYRI